MFRNIPFDRVQWVTSGFLIITAFLTFTAVPTFIWFHGWDASGNFQLWFFVGLFFAYHSATGFSITVGYHRLFSHQAFRAKWPVRLFTLIFGAAAFENSALWWCSEHRKHHQHVDTDDDPYDITKGFFWAHMGWLMFKLKPEPPLDNVKDMEKDPLVMWQHRWIHLIAFVASFVVPTVAGYAYASTTNTLTPWLGALAGFLIPGVARIVCVQQGTFCINSLCHMIGERPYSRECSARDSWIAAIWTFGEGYHNYHHEFQWDYRNGVKPWQLDPSKWIIWLLSKIGLANDLKLVPKERILLAETRETHRLLKAHISSIEESSEKEAPTLAKALENLHELAARLTEICDELLEATHAHLELSKVKFRELRLEVRTTLAHLDDRLALATP